MRGSKGRRGNKMTQQQQKPEPAVIKPVRKQEIEFDDPRSIYYTLVSQTCPYGTESAYYGPLLQALGFKKDAAGNWEKKVGESKVAFVAHMDTVCDRVYDTDVMEWSDENGEVWASANANVAMGADDRAGMTVLFYLLHAKVPGRYIFMVGEEKGCVGAGKYVVPPDVKIAVEFDRMNESEIITHQMSRRCASDKFANELAGQFELLGISLKPSDNGVYTDVNEFRDSVPEIVNIAIGYQHQHSPSEIQNITFLERMCAAAAMIDWENLPVVRDLSVSEYIDYPYYERWERVGASNWQLKSRYSGGWRKREETDWLQDAIDAACMRDANFPYDLLMRLIDRYPREVMTVFFELTKNHYETIDDEDDPPGNR